jgi:hypothetical protein
MTREVAELVVFLPRFQAALEPLAPDTNRLEVVLSQQSAYGQAAVAAVFAAKAAALRQFRGEVDGVAGQLRKLQPPAVSKPSYDGQLTSLTGMATSAGRLATALETGAQANIAPLLTASEPSSDGSARLRESRKPSRSVQRSP